MDDLFAAPTTLQPIKLPGADLLYTPAFDLGAAPEAILLALINQTPWRQDNITVWGKTHLQPRLVAWYGDLGRSYRYSGIVFDPLPWTEALSSIKSKVEAAANHRFNSVLLNYYRDQTDSMGLHSDDEPELGPAPVIASVSLGAERALVLKSRVDAGARTVRLPLASGSLLLMRGDTQANYKHGISKQTRPLGARINLTFRRIIT